MFQLRCTYRILLLVVLVGVAWEAIAQRSVGLLRTPESPAPAAVNRAAEAPTAESFTFNRNLIFFEALVDGQPGNFMLDTGAPSLVVNNRGETGQGSNYTGYGTGGQVELTDHRVEAFEMGGLSVENYWAIGLDLRGMESRVGHRIDGMVGYDLLKGGELRIDYSERSFRLLPSERRPTHQDQAPRAVLRFGLVDHLPVVRLRINGRRYDFAIDTGAGSNVIDARVARQLQLETTGESIYIQGLDGREIEAALVNLPAPDALAEHAGDIQLVAMDLSHLHRDGQALAGILGSAFLSEYTIGIDYRRRRIYVW